MPAYVFVNVEIHDHGRYPDYIQVAPDSIRQYGGRYLARGGRAEPSRASGSRRAW